MKPRILFLTVLLVVLAACNRPGAPTATPLPTATTAPSATLSPPPATTAAPAPTFTPLPPTVTASRPPSSTSTSTPLPATTAPPAPSATPAPPTATTAPPPTQPPSAAVLKLALFAPLMAAPAGTADEPLIGVMALAVDPFHPGNPLVAAGTNADGVLLSRDGGASWTWSASGLPAGRSISGLAISGQVLVAWDETGAAYQSRDAGASWQAIAALGSGVERVTLSPDYASDGVIFVVRSGALWRSGDGAQSFGQVLPANNCPLNAALNSTFANNRLVFAPRCERVARSLDGGLTWQTLDPQGEPLAMGSLMNLHIVAERGAEITLLAQGSSQGLPVASYDGGLTWQRAYNPDQATFGLGSLGALAVGLDGRWFVAGLSHLYESGAWIWQSTDRGENWVPLAWMTGLRSLAVGGDSAAWLGTPDGVFRQTSGGWQWLSAGGNRQELLSPAASGVALVRRGVDKYTAEWRLFEKRGGAWEYVFSESYNQSPRRAFPAPNYAGERMLLVLGQDYGGMIRPHLLRPDAAEPLLQIDAIPAGPGDSLDRYQVTFAADYATSGRIDLRHGYSGALYQSADRGLTWTRPDPAEPGACERNPVSGFGALWLRETELRSRLLCPLEDEQPYAGTLQAFEHGELLRLDPVTTGPSDVWTYGFVPDYSGGAGWATLPTYEIGQPFDQPPAGLYPPDPLFYAAWAEGFCCWPGTQPVRDVLGWALGEAQGVSIARQRFEGGTLIWRSDRDEILVLEQVNGDHYTVYPD